MVEEYPQHKQTLTKKPRVDYTDTLQHGDTTPVTFSGLHVINQETIHKNQSSCFWRKQARPHQKCLKAVCTRGGRVRSIADPSPGGCRGRPGPREALGWIPSIKPPPPNQATGVSVNP